jgi:hypothetical protein
VVLAELEQVAQRQGISLAGAVRQALTAWLDAQKE